MDGVRDRHRPENEERSRMVNAKIVAAKVAVALVAVGSLGLVGAGSLGGAVAEAAPQVSVTTTPAGPSAPSAAPPHRTARQRACRLHQRHLARYAKAQARSAARIAKAKARGTKAQTAGHAKSAQFWQGAATHRSSTLAREQSHLSKRTAAVARRNAKLGITC
jgi:hypothetical protein